MTCSRGSPINRLPFRRLASSEFECARGKPVGDGFVGVPVAEFQGTVFRPVLEKNPGFVKVNTTESSDDDDLSLDTAQLHDSSR